MSYKRNHTTDQISTANLLRLAGQAQVLALDTRPNWLKHSAKTADLDKALILGATMAELKAIRETVSNHLSHLRIDHGLTIVEENGIFRLTD